MTQISVFLGRTNRLPVALGDDVSADVFTSEIRVAPERDSELIATWAVSFVTDGSDGELLLTLDDAVTATIDKPFGYMDIKRVTAGEPIPVFDDPIQVIFKDTVTQ